MLGDLALQASNTRTAPGSYHSKCIPPDGDGLNDTWQVRDTTGRFAARWQIFNRWGQEVSHGSFPGSGWTGTDERRQPCPDGVYFYILAIENSSIHQEERGWVKLIR
ncbi:MAG: gliding motility-associated C-terminal domain-containing protein [Bacteroidetes bacterium]|nr:gliding motility-associated C-terminal domain-containing protein [Bacteroidota bacterium]